MKKRSVILQKKLRELEIELADVIRLPLDPASPPGPLQQIAFADINKRFSFLENLLSQEIASRPRNSAQLDEIGERLTLLKSAFGEWNDLRLSVCFDCTHALLLQGGFRDSVKGEDCPQVVPCGGGSGSDSDSGPEVFPGEETVDKLLDGAEKDKDVHKEEAVEVVVVAVEEEKVWSRMGKYGGAFGCGMIVGAFCAVKWFFIAFTPWFIEYEALLLPPT